MFALAIPDVTEVLTAPHPLSSIAATPAPAPSSNSMMSFFSKPLYGKLTYGEAGLGAAAIAVATKLMRMW